MGEFQIRVTVEVMHHFEDKAQRSMELRGDAGSLARVELLWGVDNMIRETFQDAVDAVEASEASEGEK